MGKLLHASRHRSATNYARRASITGFTCQEGACPAELLPGKGYDVASTGPAPIRGEAFVTPEIARGLIRIRQQLESCLYWGNLNGLRGRGRAATSVCRHRTCCCIVTKIHAAKVGFKGALRFDTSKPDGAPRKLRDTSRLTALGWSPRIELEAGIRSTYEWFLNNREVVKT